MNRTIWFGLKILKQIRTDMDCALCKDGNTKPGHVTVTLEKGKAIILIKNVPEEVCANCGHYYLTEEMTKLVLNRGKDAVSKGAELEIVNLEVA